MSSSSKQLDLQLRLTHLCTSQIPSGTSHANPNLCLSGQLNAQTWCSQQKQPGTSLRQCPATLKLHTEPPALQHPPAIWATSVTLPHFPSDNADQGSSTWVCLSSDMFFQTTADFPGKLAPEPDGAVKLSKNLLPSPPWKQQPTTTNIRSFLITNTFWQQAGWAGSAHHSLWASVIRILTRASWVCRWRWTIWRDDCGISSYGCPSSFSGSSFMFRCRHTYVCAKNTDHGRAAQTEGLMHQRDALL